MTSGDIPSPLQAQAEFIRTYISSNKQRSMFLAAEPGCGRGHVVKTVLKEEGLTPVWLDAPTSIPPTDIDGNRLFPVYDLAKPEVLPWASIVLIESQDQMPKDEKPPVQVMGFPRPMKVDIMDVCEAHHWPVKLADLNTTYADIMNAGRTWEVSEEIIGREHDPVSAWDEFRNGGDAPFDPPLLSFYAAYNLDPKDSTWNRDLWLLSRVKAPVARILWERLRLIWPKGTVRFPEILRTKKAGGRGPKQYHGRKDAMKQDEAPMPAKKTEEKTYEVGDW
jgi:hypothetical protein